jgi:hypothetical protein
MVLVEPDERTRSATAETTREAAGGAVGSLHAGYRRSVMISLAALERVAAVIAGGGTGML